MIRLSRTIATLLDQYRAARPQRPSSEYQLRRTIRLFGEFLGRIPLLVDLEPDVVNAWLEWLEGTHRQATRAGHRVKLLCLWRFAADLDLVDWPRHIRGVRSPEPLPVAWTLPEFRRLLDQIENLVDLVPSGAPKRDYFRGIVLAAWDTGLRRSDLWSLERSQIRDDGVIWLYQSKTGRPHFPRLRAETLAAVLALPGERPLACPWRSPRTWYRVWHREVIEPARVPPGALQQIRRTGATYVERDQPGLAQQYLGHASAEMARHYVDRSIACDPAPQPPRVWMAVGGPGGKAPDQSTRNRNPTELLCPPDRRR